MVFDKVLAPPPDAGSNYSAEQGCFEGPEKLLEIWFSPTSLADKAANLRNIDRQVWDAMLATVKCTVLNTIRSPHADAYLLSESSMFVYPHKLIIKTCGATTLLSALPLILDIAKTHCGYQTTHRLFYSRKSFMFPEKQLEPHRCWDDEVRYLDTFFGMYRLFHAAICRALTSILAQGAAYTVGDTNGDEWYLYMTTPTEIPAVVSPCSKPLFQPQRQLRKRRQVSVPRSRRDQTIEILMTQLNPAAMKPFYHRAGEPAGLEGGRRVDLETGLAKVYPSANVDSYLFEPCGYSANGLLDEGYYTIHVTPEPQCSYASFETTIPAIVSHAVKNPGKLREGSAEAVCMLIRQVIDIFQPGTFTVTHFASRNEDDDGTDQLGKMLQSMCNYGGYKRKDRICYEFDGYDLVFGQYKKI
ncbi:S-adenosylmethionine decarboxylase [Dichotomocladium elegans]|nr:S-adenosylmethionine decarboxylase [Dichotomocladium elegans]